MKLKNVADTAISPGTRERNKFTGSRHLGQEQNTKIITQSISFEYESVFSVGLVGKAPYWRKDGHHSFTQSVFELWRARSVVSPGNAAGITIIVNQTKQGGNSVNDIEIEPRRGRYRRIRMTTDNERLHYAKS
jgi:hypothetical protein